MKKSFLVFVAVMLFGFMGKAQITSGIYVIENAHFANQVLQGKADGGIQLANIVSSNEQKWQVTDVGNGFYRLEYIGIPAKCLDASAGTKGKVQLWNILGNSNQYGTGGKNQLWKFVAGDNGTYKIYNGWYTDMVLDASMSQTGKVQLWKDLGNGSQYVPNANNQRWKLIKK